MFFTASPNAHAPPPLSSMIEKHPTNKVIAITPALKEGDLLIVASASGETNSVCQAVKSAQKENVEVIAITANEQSTLYKLQQALITIKVSTKFNTVNITKQPLGSLFEQALLIIFDAIILKIAKENENMNSVMAMRHANVE